MEHLFARLLTPEEREKYAHMRQRRSEQRPTARKQLKDHLSTLNDGVIAIIITVMLLEIPIPAGRSEYGAFAWSIAVFFISFFVVADFWYENKKVFSLVDEAGHGFMILNFLFLAVLGLIPVMTKWIMNSAGGLAAVNYGAVYLLTLLAHFALYFTALRRRFRGHSGLFVKLVAFRLLTVLVPNLALIFLALRWPRPVVIAYVLLPLLSFLQPD
jgi:uncharacterized membrane protein